LLCPEPVHKVEIIAKRGQEIRGVADKHSGQAVCPKFLKPGGKAGEAERDHEDEGVDDLHLVFSRSADMGIESGKGFHDGIQIQHFEFFPGSAKFKAESCALRGIKVYFRLHAGNSDTPDGTANKLTYVCPPLVFVKSEYFFLTKEPHKLADLSIGI